MPFADLMNDTVALLKKDGTKFSSLKANVQRNKIFMDAGKLLIEPEDLILRTMSNGAEETYRVIDPGFYEAFHGIPSNYQMEVQKLGVPEAKKAVQNITFNITGHNARINQNSIDNSTNVVQVDSTALQNLQALRAEISRLHISEEERVSAIEVVDTVEEQFKSGAPKKSVVSALLNSLPHVANITSIVAAIVSLM
ncbi:MAG: hypothetical protein HZB47_05405 [Nitrosomonadales bacterium]|nr:hypothetical protein [Nitrosomonadales bacterium]